MILASHSPALNAIICVGKCIWPGCIEDVFKNEMCSFHNLHFGEPEPKLKKAIPLKSLRRTVEDRQYKKLLKAETETDCEVKSPVCIGKMQGFNHKQKRSPNNLLKKENLERCCNACNLYCETHPLWAKENNHFISRFKKVV